MPTAQMLAPQQDITESFRASVPLSNLYIKGHLSLIAGLSQPKKHSQTFNSYTYTCVYSHACVCMCENELALLCMYSCCAHPENCKFLCLQIRCTFLSLTCEDLCECLCSNFLSRPYFHLWRFIFSLFSKPRAWL